MQYNRENYTVRAIIRFFTDYHQIGGRPIIVKIHMSRLSDYPFLSIIHYPQQLNNNKNEHVYN